MLCFQFFVVEFLCLGGAIVLEVIMHFGAQKDVSRISIRTFSG
jgi:hypothetical protein